MKNKHVHNIVLSALNESVIDCQDSFRLVISQKLSRLLGEAYKNIGNSLLESVKTNNTEKELTESYFLQNPQLQNAIDYVVAGVIKEGVNSFENYINLAENKFGIYNDSLKSYFANAINESPYLLPKQPLNKTELKSREKGYLPRDSKHDMFYSVNKVTGRKGIYNKPGHPSTNRHDNKRMKTENVSDDQSVINKTHHGNTDKVFENAPSKVAKMSYKGPIKKVPTNEDSHISAIKNFIASPRPNVKADDVFGPRPKKSKISYKKGKFIRGKRS